MIQFFMMMAIPIVGASLLTVMVTGELKRLAEDDNKRKRRRRRKKKKKR